MSYMKLLLTTSFFFLQSVRTYFSSFVTPMRFFFLIVASVTFYGTCCFIYTGLLFQILLKASCGLFLFRSLMPSINFLEYCTCSLSWYIIYYMDMS